MPAFARELAAESLDGTDLLAPGAPTNDSHGPCATDPLEAVQHTLRISNRELARVDHVRGMGAIVVSQWKAGYIATTHKPARDRNGTWMIAPDLAQHRQQPTSPHGPAKVRNNFAGCIGWAGIVRRSEKVEEHCWFARVSAGERAPWGERLL